MIRFKGFGLILITAVYFGGLRAGSLIASSLALGDKVQYLLLVFAHIFLTAFNYLTARFLNRNGIKHSVFDIKLETIVLAVGGILTLPILMMAKGVLF